MAKFEHGKAFLTAEDLSGAIQAVSAVMLSLIHSNAIKTLCYLLPYAIHLPKSSISKIIV